MYDCYTEEYIDDIKYSVGNFYCKTGKIYENNKFICDEPQGIRAGLYYVTNYDNYSVLSKLNVEIKRFDERVINLYSYRYLLFSNKCYDILRDKFIALPNNIIYKAWDCYFDINAEYRRIFITLGKITVGDNIIHIDHGFINDVSIMYEFDRLIVSTGISPNVQIYIFNLLNMKLVVTCTVKEYTYNVHDRFIHTDEYRIDVIYGVLHKYDKYLNYSIYCDIKLFNYYEQYITFLIGMYQPGSDLFLASQFLFDVRYFTRVVNYMRAIQ